MRGGITKTKVPTVLHLKGLSINIYVTVNLMSYPVILVAQLNVVNGCHVHLKQLHRYCWILAFLTIEGLCASSRILIQNIPILPRPLQC